jgi:O-antigen/teichoic acid export membrane protein
LAIGGLTAMKAVTTYSVAVVVSSILIVYFVNKLFRLRGPISISRSAMRRMFAFSLPMYVADLLVLLGPNLRTLLLGALNSVSSAGIFTVASRVSMVGSAFHEAIVMMSMPIISKLHADGDLAEMKRFSQTMTKWIFSFNLPVLLLILFFSRFILSVFGSSFVAGSAGLVILAAKNQIDAAVGISSAMIFMTGNTWLNTVNSVIRLVLTLTLSILLIPNWGVLGAAVATAVSMTILDAILLVEVFILFRLLPYDKSFIKPVTAGAFSALLTWALVRWVFPAESILSILTNMALCVSTYVGVILLLGLSEEDQIVLQRLYARLARVPIIAKLR